MSFPIAGLDHLGHGDKVTDITRLKEIYEDREGLLVKMVGGEYVDFKDGKKKSASAVIEFECDPDRSGLEGIKDIPEESSENEYEQEAGERVLEWTIQNEPHLAEDDETGNITRSLQFRSFGPSDDGSYVLRLDWRTRYACDNYLKDRKDNQSSGRWGFLTWLIIMYDNSPFLNPSTNKALTNAINLQHLPLHSGIPDLRLLAQLQSLRCSWMGPTSSW